MIELRILKGSVYYWLFSICSDNEWEECSLFSFAWRMIVGLIMMLYLILMLMYPVLYWIVEYLYASFEAPLEVWVGILIWLSIILPSSMAFILHLYELNYSRIKMIMDSIRSFKNKYYIKVKFDD